jgi:hypothetical protein
MPIFLITARTACEDDAPPADLSRLEGLFEDCTYLWPGLALVEAEASQSRVYHEVKWSLPDGCAVVVVTLEHQPKFKGVRKGALKWVRERWDSMPG